MDGKSRAGPVIALVVAIALAGICALALFGPSLLEPKTIKQTTTPALPTLNVKWKTRQARQVQTPVFANNVVYVVCASRGLYALDAQTGRVKWDLVVPGTWASSPTVADGIVYFTIELVGSTAYLYAVDAQTGKQKWEFKAEDEEASQPVVSDGMVYFVGISRGYGNDTGHVYAVDEGPGRVRWKLNTNGQTSILAVADDLLVHDDDTGYLYALDSKTSRERWRSDTISRSPVTLLAPPEPSKTVYLATANQFTYGAAGYLYAIDIQTGKQEWAQRTDNGWYSSLALWNGTLYFAANQKRYECEDNCDGAPSHYTDYLYGLDATTGKERLKVQVEAGPIPYVLAQGGSLIYSAERRAAILVADLDTGSPKWMFLLKGYLYAGPAQHGGLVYFGDESGDFFAAQLPKANAKP